LYNIIWEDNLKKPISISYSSVSRYKECPTKYFLSKKYKTRTKYSALYFGKAIDTALSHLLLTKNLEESIKLFEANWMVKPADEYDPEEPIFDSRYIKYYNSDYDYNYITDEDKILITSWRRELFTVDEDWKKIFDSLKDGYADDKLTDESELAFCGRVFWACLRRKGIVMLKAFNEKIIPNVEEVIAVQHKLETTNEEGDKNVGFVDAILKYKGYDKPIVFDIKTAAYKYKNHDLDTSEQLKTYSAVLEKDLHSRYVGYLVLIKKLLNNKSCDKCGHIRTGMAKNCTKCKEGTYSINDLDCDIQVLVKEMEPVELDEIMEDYSNVLTAIKNNVTYKNPKACFAYGRVCEFYNVCHKRMNPNEIEDLVVKEEKVLDEPKEE
jgi:hypothetical protein